MSITKTYMLRLIIFLRPFARYILIAWVITIIALSSVPNIPTLKVHIAKTVFRVDHLVHFIQYGILSFVTFLTFAGREFKMPWWKFVMLTAGLILFAVADEYHQKYIPGRSSNLKDMASNISGILVTLIFSIVVFKMILLRLNKRN